MEGSQLGDDVKRLREALGELPDPVVRPSLVMVSGLPGTGKSYFCLRLAERVPLVILESDNLRKLLFPCPEYTWQEHHRLFRACHRLVEELLKSGTTIAFDATNLEEHHREPLYHIASQAGAKLILVQVDAPPEVVYQRLRERGMGLNPEDKSDADWTVYNAMQSRVERIGRKYLLVDTSRDISAALDKVVRRMNQ